MSQMECDQFAPFTHILFHAMKLKEMLKVWYGMFYIPIVAIKNEWKKKKSK